jgi:hypothetical protein
VGNVALGRRGWPLLASVGYRGEIIGPGPNGLVLVDARGTRHEMGAAESVTVEVLKHGPILAVIRWTGRLPIGNGGVGVTLTCELPNSKSWIKISADIDDPQRLVRGVAIETPFALGAFPWLWDFGTENGTYGAFRSEQERAVLTHDVARNRRAWRVDTGSAAEPRLYEQSMPGRASAVGGWGHLQDARNVIAFAVDTGADRPGQSRMSIDATGHTALTWRSSTPATRHALTVYQHYVSTPTPIGAATSPTAMLSPLLVTVQPK